MLYMLGGAGYRNFGDELMVRGWLEFFRDLLPGEQVVVDGASKQSLKQTFAEGFPGVGFADLVNRLSEKTDIEGFWGSFLRGLSFFARGGFDRYKSLKAEAEPLLAAKVIHLHGGGYLNNHFPKKAFLMGLAVAVAERTGARLVATGLGLMPLTPPPAADAPRITEALARFALIETRDVESAALLAALAPEANVVSGLDDTFLGTLRFVSDVPGRRLHLSWNESATKLPQFAQVEAFVQANHAAYDEVIFWDCAPNDAGTWARLAPQVPGIRQLGFQEMVTAPFPISPGDHMLTARFHPHMIGARGGAVGGYHSPGTYYDVKHGSVAALGSGFFQIGDKPISAELTEAGPNTLATDATKLRARKLETAISAFPEAKAPPKRRAAKTADKQPQAAQ